MSKFSDRDPGKASETRLSKRSRLQALMFTGTAFATAAWTLGIVLDPKLPPFQGE